MAVAAGVEHGDGGTRGGTASAVAAAAGKTDGTRRKLRQWRLHLSPTLRARGPVVWENSIPVKFTSTKVVSQWRVPESGHRQRTIVGVETTVPDNCSTNRVHRLGSNRWTRRKLRQWVYTYTVSPPSRPRKHDSKHPPYFAEDGRTL